MALFGFGSKKEDTKKKGDSAEASETEEAVVTTVPAQDITKARRFFEHAHKVEDTGNFEYAVEMYVKGLKFNPANEEEHKRLRDASLKRKAKGGKAAGMVEAMKLGAGKSPDEKMANTLLLLAKDPGNGQHMITMVDALAKLHVAMEESHGLSLRAVTSYYMEMALDAASKNESLAKKGFAQLYKSAYEAGDLKSAREALANAAKMDPANGQLARDLKNIEAEITTNTGRYDQTDRDFRASVKDLEAQQQLHQEDAMTNAEDTVEQIIQRYRQHWTDNPDDVDGMQKLVNKLLETEEKQYEDEAIGVLKEGFEQFSQYRFKMRIGDVRMKQYKRVLREITNQINTNPGDQELLAKRQKINASRLKFEIQEFTERSAKYPSDMSIRYELGVRQFNSKLQDDAIANFQQAQNDPKYRSRALFYLGRCFLGRQWYDEATDTFRKAIEAHHMDDDHLAKEARYYLMDSLEANARETRDMDMAREAQKIASSIAQADFNFKDIRDRMDGIKKLIAELRG